MWFDVLSVICWRIEIDQFVGRSLFVQSCIKFEHLLLTCGSIPPCVESFSGAFQSKRDGHQGFFRYSTGVLRVIVSYCDRALIVPPNTPSSRFLSMLYQSSLSWWRRSSSGCYFVVFRHALCFPPLYLNLNSEFVPLLQSMSKAQFLSMLDGFELDIHQSNSAQRFMPNDLCPRKTRLHRFFV
jgi:hypothetical protein